MVGTTQSRCLKTDTKYSLRKNRGKKKKSSAKVTRYWCNTHVHGMKKIRKYTRQRCEDENWKFFFSAETLYHKASQAATGMQRKLTLCMVHRYRLATSPVKAVTPLTRSKMLSKCWWNGVMIEQLKPPIYDLQTPSTKAFYAPFSQALNNVLKTLIWTECPVS